MRLLFSLCCISLILLQHQAHAQEWENVGTSVSDNPKYRYQVYVDKKTASRKGDVGEIKLKLMTGSMEEDWIKFDCEKNIMYIDNKSFPTTQDLLDNSKGVGWPTSLLKNMQKIACKRWYEAWK
ncbi:hypothetical protein [Hydrogenophaga defluvii]|uniref:Uncharacterized protein n=1 Tax=Hydrogenophaga defluvii TaxID=249410 RepID=A0ABW2SDH0_9BURK